MAIAGDYAPWADTFPDLQIPDVIDLILRAWKGFERPRSRELEDAITNRFCVRIRQLKESNRVLYRFRIDPQCQLLDHRGVILGIIDLQFSHGLREDVYLAFECKRLGLVYQGGWRSNAGEYVGKGMMRFISEQYAGDLLTGGMIGYVMDGYVEKSVAAVNDAIQSASALLRLRPPFELRASSVLPDRPEVLETTHELPKGVFTMHHICLPV
jgi:hypothetical protein